MSLKEKYFKEVIPAMVEKFGCKSSMMVPRITKVVVNSGIGAFRQDENAMKEIEQGLTLITGQKPVLTKARKAIAGFKIRAGNGVGLKVTMRGEKMYDFLERLINLAIPRVRDFRGIDRKSFDQFGNLTVGFKEHIVFPEISHEHVHKIFGLEVCVATTARSKDEGIELLKLLGFPVKK